MTDPTPNDPDPRQSDAPIPFPDDDGERLRLSHREFRPYINSEGYLVFHGDPERQCSHINVIVDEERAIVECEDCQKVLDPFAVLLRMAKIETHLNHALGLHRERRERANAERGQRRTIRQQTCKHTRAREMTTGRWHCPSCGLEWDKTISIKDAENTSDA